MDKFQHILLPTDFSPCADIAVAYASHFARKSQGKITMLHVSMIYDEDPTSPSKGRAEDVILQEPESAIRRRMQDQLARFASDGLKVDMVQIQGLTVADAIAEFAERNNVELIIMGTHGRRGFKRWLLGSVAEELVRLAPCPVLSIKEGWEMKPEELERILVPIDFSLASRTALHGARALAQLLGARLQVLHVIQPPPYPDIYTYASTEDFYEEARLKSMEVMNSLLAEEGPASNAECYVVTGHPAREILKFTESHHAQMILMAHLGISGLSDRILGSVTEHVVRSAPCPVLTADLGQ